MQKIALANTTASIVASTVTPGTPGWFTDGVPPGTGPSEIGADWFNSVQEELVALVEGAGGTVHATGTFGPQIFDIYCGALALVAASGSSGMALTDSHWKRALLASTNSAANGVDAIVAASVGSSVNSASTECAVIASSDSHIVGGQLCAAIASSACAVPSLLSAAIASDTATINAGYSATLGTHGVTLTGDYTAGVACDGSSVNGYRCGVFAAQNCQITGARQWSAIVGSVSCTVAASAAVVLASRDVTLAQPYSVGGGYSASGTPGTNTNLNWRLDSVSGDILGSGTVATGDPNADYAEMFPNETPGALPVGSLVARAGKSVRLAKAGDRVLGVVSAAPAVLGNAADLCWAGAHKRGEFGERLRETDKDGVSVSVVADGFDPAKLYTPRRQRPADWTAVGLVGQLRIRVDATVTVDSDVVPGAAGVGTAGEWKRGAQVECMAIESPFDAARGYGIALCLVR